MVDQIDGIHLDGAARRRQLLDPGIVQIAGMIVDGPAAGMRTDDGRARHFHHLVEDIVGGMAGIQHDAQIIGLLHELLAQRRQPVPFRLVGGGIAELVVEEMHRPAMRTPSL